MTERDEDMDSLMTGLTTAARSRKGRTIAQAVWPYILGALASAATGVGGWAAAKLDTKSEVEGLRSAVADLAAQQRALVARIDDDLLTRDPGKPGRVYRLERGHYFAWRALSELRAAVYASEPPARRKAKETQATRFGASFDKRADEDPPWVAYDTLFAQVAVP